ncbi:hypothetical protein [Pseudochelatococcus contaminans]|uniref:Uncharacterized protein n=1 Tax=Pseudochelatococcus contaminans TaxID=1538103 RepID=A0A7W5Z4T1_9HYPH|nr:hypothetical protein [Pseudochelatococcus contaminans]MBB3810191.1 hypothetical protein [Pseudochelatococcus contaminans]
MDFAVFTGLSVAAAELAIERLFAGSVESLCFVADLLLDLGIAVTRHPVLCGFALLH